MTSEGTGPERTEQQLIDRAGTDPNFRAQLLENPKGAIGQLLGTQLPDGIAIRVIEEQPGEVVLVLPPRERQSGEALSDKELEEVAGGGAVSWAGGTSPC
jgi:hypothetical protein